MLRLIIPALAGGMIGGGLVGLIEAVYLTLNDGYERWTLPFCTMAYYSIWGLLVGLAFFCAVAFTIIVFKVKLRSRQVFAVFASAMVVYLSLFPAGGSFAGLFGIRPVSIVGILVISAAVAVLYVAAFYVFKTVYNLFSKIYKNAALPILIIHICVLLIAGAAAMASPVKPDGSMPYIKPSGHRLTGKPNVVFLLVDCLRYDWISPSGYDIYTPAMRSLADDGIKFNNCISNSNWTMPAVASILTSLEFKDHGAITIFSRLSDQPKTLPEELSKKGYFTAGFSTNPNITERTGFDRGFNEFYYIGGRSQLPFDEQGPKSRRMRLLDWIAGKIFPALERRKIAFLNAEPLTLKVVNWMRKHRNDRYFIYLHYMDPHVPYYHHPYNGQSSSPYRDDPGEENRELYSSLFKGEVEYIDNNLSMLLDYLKNERLYDSTLIILTADHGEAFFEHYVWEHGKVMYDEVIHVPLIIKLPQSENAGAVDSSLVCQLDFAPTIMKLLNFEVPPEWKGQNIFNPYFNNQYVFSQAMSGGIENTYRIRSIRTLDYKLIVADLGYPPSTMTTGKGAPVDERAVFPAISMFNIRSDSAEKVNIFDQDSFRIIRDSMMALDSILMAEIPSETYLRPNEKLDPKVVRQLRQLGYLK